LASDTSSIHEALQHAVTEYESDTQGEDRIDAVAFVPANVPTVKARVLRDCFRELDRNPEATAAMTVVQVTQRPEWMWRLDPGTKYLRREGSGRAYRMQDLPDRYIATGTCAVVRRDVLMACRTGAAYKWLGPRIRMVLDPGAIEIHDREDYERAKETLQSLAGGPRA
jgi:CMP-N-acetylneuraminic acid synthetase